MQHRLSVTGTLPKESIPVLRGIEVENDGGGITFTSTSPEEMKRLKRMLSFSLADLITGEYEKKRLSDIINAHHSYLAGEERREVLRHASLAMQSLPPTERTHYIEDKLYTFLKDSEVLSVEGFVNFRLKEYKERLSTAAEEAAAVYMAEKEYEEFISLLKYYVYMQPARMQLLHVVIGPEGAFRLYDSAFKDVTKRMKDEIKNEDTGMLSSDDLLVSLLITLAPQKIVLHRAENFQNKNVPETVFKVFGKRVRFCDTCALCGFRD